MTSPKAPFANSAQSSAIEVASLHGDSSLARFASDAIRAGALTPFRGLRP